MFFVQKDSEKEGCETERLSHSFSSRCPKLSFGGGVLKNPNEDPEIDHELMPGFQIESDVGLD